MEILRWCCVLALLGLVAAQCRTKRNCGDCITSGCRWCENPVGEEHTVYNCFAEGEDHIECKEEHLYPKKTKDTFIVVDDKSFGINVLFKPQSVELNLNVGEKYDLLLKYKHARNYPVDLYYLMDLSASMRDDKDNLSKLGNKLASVMQNITTDFRLGFGSFVDKVEMPFVSTVKEKLEHPCENCVAPYGFKNHLKLDNDTKQFAMKVNEAKVSGNLDTPEGGFDALMQAIVCQQQIGWRKKARHLLVFSTDAEFHFAGDGRLAGLVEPNDMKCYMTQQGKYTKSTEFDYPSISQINQVAQDFNMNLIFAVTSRVITVYKLLSERINGASYGKLDKDSSNVVDLIKVEYQKIVDSLTMIATVDPELVDVTISTQCKERNGNWIESATCGGLHQGDEIMFKARIEVLKCPPNGTLTFKLKPVSLEDHVEVKLNVVCECPCEKPNSPTFVANSEKCHHGGNMQCGVCVCNPDRYGDFCQCILNNNEINQNDTTDSCRVNEDAPICSDAGVCKCGACTCNERDNPSERYSGKYCECDNFTCLRIRDKLCSGSDHGTCVCGKCKCHSGWSGDACECASNKYTCFQPGTNVECSGRGKCECGTCKCQEIEGVMFHGKYCQDCPTCQSQQCAIYSDQIACQVFDSGPLRHDCPKINFTIKMVDSIEEPDVVNDNLRICRIPQDDGCYFYFRYEVDSEVVEVQRTMECPEPVNVLAVVLGVVGGIVLLGILLLIAWKIVTTIHDGREYAKFEKESKNAQFDRGANPLYVPSTTTFENPTFRG